MNWTSDTLTQCTDAQFEQLYREQKPFFIEQMLQHLQKAEATVREPFAIQPFFRLLQLQLLSEEEKRQFYEALASEAALFYVGTEEAVITRASAAFMLSQLLPQMETLQDFNAVIRYVRFEKDGRGQISESIGWSDAIGGAIDLAMAAVVHPNFQAVQHVELLQAIRTSIWSVPSYSNNEEERFAKLAVLMLQKGLPADAFTEWVEQLVDQLEFYAYDYGHDLQWFTARTNTMAVLRALYFACKFSKQDKKLEAIVSLFIQKYML